MNLSAFDIDHIIVYNEDLNKMIEKTKRNFLIQYKEDQKIKIPENEEIKNFRTEFDSIIDLIMYFYSFGENKNLYPYHSKEKNFKENFYPNYRGFSQNI